MKYLVCVEVKAFYDFEIEAENEDEAQEKAIEEAYLIDRIDDYDCDVCSIEEIQ